MALLLKQFYLNCLAHASYVVGDSSSGAAAVVDPQRDIDQYLAFAAEHGLTIGHVRRPALRRRQLVARVVDIPARADDGPVVQRVAV